jgi:DNA replication protein DnaC
VKAQVSQHFRRLGLRCSEARNGRRDLGVTLRHQVELWRRSLPDQPTAVSLLDRLCHHAHIITNTGDSYRLTRRTTGGDTPT